MGERNPPIVIYADILFNLSWAAVLVKYIRSTFRLHLRNTTVFISKKKIKAVNASIFEIKTF
jgi:hypothetical protein